MSEKIIPVFSDVQNQAAAEALSEPFLQPKDFMLQYTQATQEPEPLNTDRLAAMGTSYIGDDGRAEFVYAMHPLAQAPFAAAQAFMEGYDSRITPAHATADETRSILGSNSIEFWKSAAIDYVKKAGLKTIGSFVLFVSEQSSDFSGGFIISNTMAQELPLESRDELIRIEQRTPEFMGAVAILAGANKKDIDAVSQKIKQNRDQENFSIYLATLHMPRMAALRGMIDEHPAVPDFATLPRKAKRTLLRTERKGLREQQS